MSGKVMWYYQSHEGRSGPVEEGEVAALITQGLIGRETLVWKSGMVDWEEAYMSELTQYFSVSSPIEYNDTLRGDGGILSNVRSYLGSRVDLPKKMRSWFLIFGITLCISILLSALGPVAWISAIASVFFGLVIMYHAWTCIPKDKRITSPLPMVLLTLLPIFNLAWLFICYYGVARRLNDELDSKGIEDFRVNESIALGYCISSVLMTVLFIVSIITGSVFESLSLLLLLAIVITQITLMKSIVVATLKLL